jgi:anti-sigma regulatory factor (Ser/Thr protein kinase)
MVQTVQTVPTLRLPPDPRSPRHAREFVGSLLERWGLPDLHDRAALITSELVTNAVLHAGTPVTVTVAVDGSRSVLRITVRDGSSVEPRQVDSGELATTGRGLSMVDQSADAFGVEPTSEGKAVWVELPLDAGGTGGTGGTAGTPR